MVMYGVTTEMSLKLGSLQYGSHVSNPELENGKVSFYEKKITGNDDNECFFNSS